MQATVDDACLDGKQKRVKALFRATGDRIVDSSSWFEDDTDGMINTAFHNLFTNVAGCPIGELILWDNNTSEYALMLSSQPLCVLVSLSLPFWEGFVDMISNGRQNLLASSPSQPCIRSGSS